MRCGVSFLFTLIKAEEEMIDLYQIMVAHCGEQNWPAESKPEIVLGAILVQNTSWESAQKSLD